MREELKLEIGFSGHLKMLDEVVADVAGAVDTVFSQFGERQTADEGECWLVHSLGEGADRMAFRVAERLGWKRRVVYGGDLDFHRERCCDEDSLAELERMVSGADEVVALMLEAEEDLRFAVADRYIAEHCDFLVVAWDGETTGHTAGTWRVVDWYLDRGLNPVYHIYSPRGELSSEGGGDVRLLDRGKESG